MCGINIPQTETQPLQAGTSSSREHSLSSISLCSAEERLLLFTEFDNHIILSEAWLSSTGAAPSETSAPCPLKFGQKTIEVCITIDFAPEKIPGRDERELGNSVLASVVVAVLPNVLYRFNAQLGILLFLYFYV